MTVGKSTRTHHEESDKNDALGRKLITDSVYPPVSGPASQPCATDLSTGILCLERVRTLTGNAELNRLAEQLLQDDGRRLGPTLLRRCMPRFYAHARRVRKERAVLRRWGWSVNVDELANTEIVDTRLLIMLGKMMDVAMDGAAVHAGVQHTYGYLLSTVMTPFGYKRDRWIQPTIELGFGLPESTLQAFPKRGTLLANLTCFLDQLAFPNQRLPKIIGTRPVLPTPLRIDRNQPKRKNKAAPELRAKRSVENGWRITERLTSRRKGLSRRLEIYTDLIPFPYSSNTADVGLLVYSLRENESPPKLITTFPIGPSMMENMLDGQPYGSNVEVRLRFNAYVKGYFGRVVRGKRSCTALPGD